MKYRRLVLLSLGLALLWLAAHQFLEQQRRIDRERLGAEIESIFSGTELIPVLFEDETLLPDDYLCFEREDLKQPLFSVYIGYFPHKGLGEKFPHRPELCYATQRFKIVGEPTRETWKSADGSARTVERMNVVLDGKERQVFFWTQSRGELGPQQESGILGDLWERLVTRRTDRSWVRIELDPELVSSRDWSQAGVRLMEAVGKAML